MTPLDIDLILMTYNEEQNLERCLESVQDLVRNIFVVDSGSTDHTVEIARGYGAHVVPHEFTTQAEQFNWALDNLPLQSEWVLRLDGDEYLLPQLREELSESLPKVPPKVSGLYMKRRMIFMERWIRHGSYYPIWLLRIFRRGKARMEEVDLNEHMVLLEGQSVQLKNDFVDEDHDGLSSWLLKHEGFAARQARLLERLKSGYDPNWVHPNPFGCQPERKRWWLSHFYLYLPSLLRAFLYFFYRYFFRLGFLDGREGLIFHFLQGCWFPFYTDAKLLEEGRYQSTPRHSWDRTALRRS